MWTQAPCAHVESWTTWSLEYCEQHITQADGREPVANAAVSHVASLSLTVVRSRLTMKLLLAPACALLIAWTAPACADINRDEAAAAAQRVSDGRVLSVDKAEADRRPVWRVKILTAQGEVRVILIDAVSGRPL